jgi:hypothetical protein
MGVDNQKKVRVILITSALPHEGNTVSSVALATALPPSIGCAAPMAGRSA